MFLLLALIIAIPLAEIYLFIQVGSAIGGWSTLLLILLTAFVGLVLIRIQGFTALIEFQRKKEMGTVPVDELFDGICLLIAGVFLVLPGFLTDSIGFLLLIPAFRRFIQTFIVDTFLGAYTFGFVDTDTVKWSKEKVSKKVFKEKVAPSAEDVIDAEFEVIKKPTKES